MGTLTPLHSLACECSRHKVVQGLIREVPQITPEVAIKVHVVRGQQKKKKKESNKLLNYLKRHVCTIEIESFLKIYL